VHLLRNAANLPLKRQPLTGRAFARLCIGYNRARQPNAPGPPNHKAPVAF
jgi:hypothetical protein